MLNVFVVEAAEADAVRKVERSLWRLTDGDQVVDLDASAAGFADAFEPAAALVSRPYQLACFLPAR
jgi:hypothetical protein